MNKILILLLITINLAISNPKFNDKKEIQAVATKIFNLLYKKDTATLNKNYIHPKYGFYILHRMGTLDQFTKYKEIDSYILKFLNFNKKSKLKIYWQSTNFSCEYEKWDKEGIFITYNKPYSHIKDIISFIEENNITTYSKAQKESVDFLSTNNYILVNTQLDIIVYIKKIDNKYYITHIDTLQNDCSA
jgi:hypothetical protein